MDLRERLIAERIINTRGLPLKADIDTVRKILEAFPTSKLQNILYETRFRKRDRYEEIRLKIAVKILKQRQSQNEDTEVTCCCV